MAITTLYESLCGFSVSALRLCGPLATLKNEKFNSREQQGVEPNSIGAPLKNPPVA
jgi:hypothetical protein